MLPEAGAQLARSIGRVRLPYGALEAARFKAGSRSFKHWVEEGSALCQHAEVSCKQSREKQIRRGGGRFVGCRD